MRNILTDKRKVRFIDLYPFYLANPFYGSLVKNVATNTINSIGWVNNHTTITQNLHCFGNFSLFGIIRVYLKKLCSHSKKFKRNTLLQPDLTYG